jgi:hypothetical protein
MSSTNTRPVIHEERQAVTEEKAPRICNAQCPTPRVGKGWNPNIIIPMYIRESYPDGHVRCLTEPERKYLAEHDADLRKEIALEEAQQAMNMP